VTLVVVPPSQATPSKAKPVAAPAAVAAHAAVTPNATRNRYSSTAYKVTIVARSCNAFSDIMANRARNNIQESLQDLGIDTVYGGGQPVDPAIEDAVATQANNCHPLVGWQFKLGTGITGKTQANDYLSTVTGAYSSTIKTVAKAPLLDEYGNNTGQMIDGAFTVTLSAEQAQRAQSGSSLWLQGGLPNDPLLNGPSTPLFNPPQAFGALRCSIDNLNGDNVEWIAYPSSTNHVFCYYYTVSPPPKAATIIVKKVVTGEPDNSESFQFAGNVSYNPSDSGNPNDDPFNVVAGSTGTTFIRAADTADPWNFYEVPTDGFIQTGVNCVKNLTSVVNVPGTVNKANPVTVTLVSGDVVTCTFTNQRDVAGLGIQKITSRGIGTFNFTASSPSGSNTVTKSVTTDTPGSPTQALDISAGSGDFTSREDLPAGADPSSWTLSSVSCNGSEITPTPAIGQDLVHSIPAGQTYTCTYVNTPNGQIIIRKTTVGGKGRFYYVIVPLGDFSLDGADGAAWSRAITTAPNTPATATDIDGTSTHLPYQDYAVLEVASPNSSTGQWVLTAATCDASNSAQIDAPSLTGVAFTLSEAKPTVTCDFTNTLYKPSTLVINKSLSGDTWARTGDVHISTMCNDALTNNLVGPAGKPGPFVSDTLIFTDFLIDGVGNSTLQCRIRETSTGAPSGVTARTRWTVRENTVIVQRYQGSSVLVPINYNKRYVVNVTNSYTSRTPSPTPTSGGGGGTGGGGTGSGGGGLPHTGANPLSFLLIFGGLGAIVSGVLVGRRPRRN
jgi:hypothetical protein